MGTGQAQGQTSYGGMNVPGGGISNLAAGLSPGMGGRLPGQMMGGQMAQPGGMMGGAFPMAGAAAPGQMPGGMMGGPQTQQQAMQALMDAQRSAPAQIPPAGMLGGQMAMPAPPGMMPGGMMAQPGMMPGGMMGGPLDQQAMQQRMMDARNAQLPTAMARPGGVPPNQPMMGRPNPFVKPAPTMAGRPPAGQGLSSLPVSGPGKNGFGAEVQAALRGIR